MPVPADQIDADQIDAAVAALRAGGVIGLPTETVYGLGADASNDDAVRRIFEVKGRPAGHPLIVHLASAELVDQWTDGSDPRRDALAAAFWPGPLTIIVPSSGLAAPSVTGGRTTVGLRVPDHPVARAVLEQFGGGVAAPSANRFGHVSPTTAAHVRADLGDAVEVVLDGGPSRVGVESTIIELVGPTPVLLRPGGISVDELERVLGEPVTDGQAGPSRAAGMMASHYAPDAPVVVVTELEAEPGADIGLIAPSGTAGVRPDRARTVWLPVEPAGYAEGLYAALRHLDQPDTAQIIVVPPTEPGDLLPAVIDRLTKASAPRP